MRKEIGEFSEQLKREQDQIAVSIVELQYRKQPEIWDKYGENGKKLSIRDAVYHLPFLREAITANEPWIFTDYILWVKQLFKNLQFPDEALTSTLECTKEIMIQKFPISQHQLFLPILENAAKAIQKDVSGEMSYINEQTESGKLAKLYINALLQGNRNAASVLILNAVENGMSVKTIYIDVFQAAQYEIGRLWLTNQINVATEHFCSAATQSIMSRLYPYIFSSNRNGKKMVAACVGGELHEIGIRMVADFFEMEGWDTYYLGANTPASAILSAVEQHQAQLVCLSAAIPHHRQLLRETIQTIRKSSNGKAIKIMIGGRAFNSETTNIAHFDADGYATDANQAVLLASKLVKL